MPNERVEATAYVHGKDFKLRFDDERGYQRFQALVERGQNSLALCFLLNGARMWLRPSSVDAITKVEK